MDMENMKMMKDMDSKSYSEKGDKKHKLAMMKAAMKAAKKKPMMKAKKGY